jgi:hypothetical protein
VVVQATNADGSAAALENTSKPTLTFTATDIGFKQVAAQVWAAAQMSEFRSRRYELAVAFARTTMRDPDRASGRVRAPSRRRGGPQCRCNESIYSAIYSINFSTDWELTSRSGKLAAQPPRLRRAGVDRPVAAR